MLTNRRHDSIFEERGIKQPLKCTLYINITLIARLDSRQNLTDLARFTLSAVSNRGCTGVQGVCSKMHRSQAARRALSQARPQSQAFKMRALIANMCSSYGVPSQVRRGLLGADSRNVAPRAAFASIASGDKVAWLLAIAQSVKHLVLDAIMFSVAAWSLGSNE